MKIINETSYDTMTIRSILCAVHTKQSSWGRGRLKTWKHLRVYVTYIGKKNGDYVTGVAWYHGCQMILRVPRKSVDVNKFVLVARHELWHNYGIKHREFPVSVMHCEPENEANAEWTKEFIERFGPVMTETNHDQENEDPGVHSRGLGSAAGDVSPDTRHAL